MVEHEFLSNKKNENTVFKPKNTRYIALNQKAEKKKSN